jgi:O-Antigen ligase
VTTASPGAGPPGANALTAIRRRLTADLLTLVTALVAGGLTAAFFAAARYPVVYGTVRAPLDIVPGLPAQLLSWTAPIPAGLTALLCVVSPWDGLLAALLLTPWFDAAQVGAWIGPVQVLGATTMVASLLAGLLLGIRDRGTRAALALRLRAHRAAFVGGALLLILATASTLVSPSLGTSGPVWLHGVVEPLLLGLLVLLLVPDRKGLIRALLVVAVAPALAGLIDLVQTLPTVASPLALQDTERTIFSRLTYFNVGLFGEILAMAIPLLAASLLARRAWGFGRRASALLAASLALCIVCLYLTFSKSGWLATGVALLVLALAAVHGRRARLGVLAAGLVVSMLVAPWPLLVLRPLAPPVADGYQAVMTRIWGPRLATWDPNTLGGEVSITERIYASGAALRMAADHPLLGVGLDRFKVEYQGPYHDARAKSVLDSAHDLLPNLAAELGIPFALLTAAAMAVALAVTWRIWWRATEPAIQLLAAGLGSAMVGWWIVSATFDPDLYRTWRLMASDIVMASVVVALALALPRVLAADRDRPPDREPDPAQKMGGSFA